VYVIIFPDDKIKVLNVKPEENTQEESVNNKLQKKVMQKEGIIDEN